MEVPSTTILVLWLHLLGTSWSQTSSVHQALRDHCLALGWNNITIITDTNSKGGGINRHDFMKRFASPSLIQVSFADVRSAADNVYRDRAGKIAIVGESLENQDFLKDVLTRRRLPYATMILGTSVPGSSFEDNFRRFNLSSGFFRLAKNGGNFTFYRVQTFRDQDVLVQNEWKLLDTDRAAGFQSEIFDLEGAEVSSLTLSWDPWLTLTDCQEGGRRRCKTGGILHNLMDLLARDSNFTWFSDESDSWGNVPMDGKNMTDPEAKFDGAMGAVVRDEYDTALSVWQWNSDRDHFADFTASFYPRETRAVLNSKRPPVDVTLFLRPFTPPSWLATMAVVAFLAAALLVPFRVFGNYLEEDSASERIAILSGWLLFILLNAYYGGALTMFFTAPSAAPFEDARQGMQLYPEWKMIILEGMLRLVR